jgi:hypothetical protein
MGAIRDQSGGYYEESGSGFQVFFLLNQQLSWRLTPFSRSLKQVDGHPYNCRLDSIGGLLEPAPCLCHHGTFYRRVDE